MEICWHDPLELEAWTVELVPEVQPFALIRYDYIYIYNPFGSFWSLFSLQEDNRSGATFSEAERGTRLGLLHTSLPSGGKRKLQIECVGIMARTREP